MRYRLRTLLAATVSIAVVGCIPSESPTAPAVATKRLVVFDIRSADGKILVAADEIRQYDWTTHSMTWDPGVKERVFTALRGELIEGSPFSVCVDGRTIYSGKFVTSFSSDIIDAVVLRDFSWEGDPNPIPDDVARLELGYPTSAQFQGRDPRADPVVRAALEDAGKLTKS